ncbi:MAG TPA: DUF2917 domain-containing protein [Candidatus Caenarcaniphilales bacterium]
MQKQQWLNYQKLEFIPTTTSTEIHLVARHAWSSEAMPGSQIVCMQGVLWLTQSGDPHDYILHPGERFLATCQGKVVVQALATAMILRHHPQTRANKQTIISAFGRTWHYLITILARGN